MIEKSPKLLFQAYIHADQYSWIREFSEKTGRSRASIVRDAIDLYRKNLEGKGNENKK